MDVAVSSRQLLLETAERHGEFEAIAPPLRLGGTGTRRTWTLVRAGARRTRRSAAADRYMAEVKNVVVSRAVIPKQPQDRRRT